MCGVNKGDRRVMSDCVPKVRDFKPNVNCRLTN